ncbi:hypothetical protein CMT45_00055 [Elizabethkingia anophelis]|nr:hypothetical protein [Elizabethkingia anophelis]
MKKHTKSTLCLFLLLILGIIAGCSRDEQTDTTENSTATSYVKSFYKTNFSYGRVATSEASKTAASKARTAKTEYFSVTEVIVGKEKIARGYIITDNTTNKELYFVDVNRASKRMTIVELETKEIITVNDIDKLDEYKETNGFDFIKIAENAVSNKTPDRPGRFWGWKEWVDCNKETGEGIRMRTYYVLWLPVITKPVPGGADGKPLIQPCAGGALKDD